MKSFLLRNAWTLSTMSIVGLCFLALFEWLPYSSGYGENRIAVFQTVRNFWRDPDWHHAALAPLLILGILWYKRKQIWKDAPETRPSVHGGWILGFALLVYWVGFRTNVHYFGFAACQLMAAGCVIWFAGWAWFKRTLFFWCLLLFTWPVLFLDEVVSFQLRMAMIQLSSGFLNTVGVEHLRVGTSIQSMADASAGLATGDAFAIDVARPCSGIRSLFALLMASAIFGYLTLRKSWQRGILFLSALPLAILGNFVRIQMLVFGTLWFGSDFAIGEDGGTSNYHFTSGIVVFVVALAGMAAIAKLFNSNRKRKTVVTSVVASTATQKPLPETA